ncbi:MAG: NUDIX domain-containing protein [Nocardioidaceae bacterium]|nr:NUDIX domain-containing protein [Nocardioidaceae bacterium]
MWACLGGGLNPGESIDASLVRELREELGPAPLRSPAQRPAPQRSTVRACPLPRGVRAQGVPRCSSVGRSGSETMAAARVSRLHCGRMPGRASR